MQFLCEKTASSMQNEQLAKRLTNINIICICSSCYYHKLLITFQCLYAFTLYFYMYFIICAILVNQNNIYKIFSKTITLQSQYEFSNCKYIIMWDYNAQYSGTDLLWCKVNLFIIWCKIFLKITIFWVLHTTYYYSTYLHVLQVKIIIYFLKIKELLQ